LAEIGSGFGSIRGSGTAALDGLCAAGSDKRNSPPHLGHLTAAAGSTDWPMRSVTRQAGQVNWIMGMRVPQAVRILGRETASRDFSIYLRRIGAFNRNVIGIVCSGTGGEALDAAIEWGYLRVESPGDVTMRVAAGSALMRCLGGAVL